MNTVITTLFSVLYFTYILKTLFYRDMSDRSERLFIKREFILDLIIPFRGWYIWLKELFKDKE